MASAALCQTTASLRGTVTDQSGGVVVGAKVTLTNTGTGLSRTTTSKIDGSYLFDLLQVGSYKLKVEKGGFATFEEAGIVLELNQNGRADVALKIGQASEVVEVAGNAPQVDTTGAVLGKVENEQMINELPLADRDTLQLGLLQAGVFNPDPDDGSNNPFSVSGQRSESLTFLLDGANNTDFLDNNIVVNPNPDAVGEFKILTNNYDAQYGRTSGGIVNQITKSGTNEFHGDAFEFLRNTVLNAQDYFLGLASDESGAPIPKQPFIRNVFGGTLGGPVKKDKAFFFIAYQGTRRREGQTSPLLTVLSPAERTGNFGELCSAYDASGNCTPAALSNGGTQLVNPYNGNNVPYNDMSAGGQGGPGANGSLVNPIMLNYINNYLPLPNIAGTNNFIASPSAAIDDDQGIVHFDYNISAHDTLSIAYLIDDTRDDYPYQIINGASSGGDVPIGSGFTDAYRTQIGSFTWVHSFSASKINQFRFAATRLSTLQGVPTTTTSPASLGFTNVNPDDPKGTAPPIMFTPNFNVGPSPQGPTTLNRTAFEFQDDYTWTIGRHELKFGGDFTRVRQNYNYDFFNNGSFDFDNYGVNYTGSALADFVGGFWDNYYQFSNAIYGVRTGSLAGYAQDTWKVLPRLTLNYGLRYEYYIPIWDVHNNILGWFPGEQSTVFPDAPPNILYPGDPGTPNRALVYPDKDNFAPRFGFAWDVLGNAKLVMRGGFGIFYDIEDGALNLQFGAEPPFGAVSNFIYSDSTSFLGYTGNGISDPYLLYLGDSSQNPFPFASRGLTGTFLTPQIPYAYLTYPHFRTPYSENFNFGFQWQATHDTMIEAVYVGSLGRKLISSGEVNFPSIPVMQEQEANFGAGNINPECARPLAACVDYLGGPVLPGPQADPNAFPTGAQQLYVDYSNGLSESHQLQVTADKRFSHGFIFRAAYTYGKTIDLTSGFRSRSSTYTDPYDYEYDRALADFDAPQRFVLSGLWILPIAQHASDTSLLGRAAKGWQVATIATFQAGQPFTVFSNNNASGQDSYLDRPNILGPLPQLNPRTIQTLAPVTDSSGNILSGNCLAPGGETGNFWFNPTNLDCQNVPLLTFGDMGRNALRGPGINNWDISIDKNIKLWSESKSLEFRAEFFNAFNHVQFLKVDGQGNLSYTFGQVISDRGPRLIQFGLKLYF